MGRIRIKKKDAVVPFRETMAYRMILTGGSLIVFISSIYILFNTISVNPITATAAGVIGAFAAFGIFFNLDRMRLARVPKRTMDRMRRR